MSPLNVVWWNQPLKSPLSWVAVNWAEIWAAFLQSALNNLPTQTTVTSMFIIIIITLIEQIDNMGEIIGAPTRLFQKEAVYQI